VDFVGTGVVPFGARTLAPISNEERFVSVVRTQQWVGDTVDRGVAFAAGETNAEDLWEKLERRAEVFFEGLWRAGALQGARVEESYFVAVGRTTTSQADLNRGVVTLTWGLAYIRPAEFFVSRVPVDAFVADRQFPDVAEGMKLRWEDGRLQVGYRTVRGFRFSDEVSNTLGNGTWIRVTPEAVGDGTSRSFELPGGSGRQFHRVRAVRMTP
jgi:hypothetical protein